MIADTSRAGQVPLWNTTLGPAAFEFSNDQWANKLFFRWDFRLIAPCTGNYLFNVGGDGMSQAHKRNFVDAAFDSRSYPMEVRAREKLNWMSFSTDGVQFYANDRLVISSGAWKDQSVAYYNGSVTMQAVCRQDMSSHADALCRR
jgi:hypothetical protein